MESLNILHLSDTHIGNFRYEDSRTLAIKIADTLTDKGRRVDVVIVSGDIFDGRSNSIEKDRKQALSLFRTLVDQLKAKDLSASDFDVNNILFVPGNHDLVRQLGNVYEKYDAFISEFYPTGSSTKIKVVDKYNFIYSIPEKKIAILGFNSCKIQVENVIESELKWIEDLDLKKFKKQADEIKKTIRDLKTKEKKWEDYGYIEPLEMDKVFTTLKDTVPSYQDYTLIATFHHHFYPFPEIANRYPDDSFIRNYIHVINSFQRYNIQLVLHGHKHLSIQRVVTDNRYFENPDSVIYVLSAGSIGSKEGNNPSFQWLRVYDKEFSKLADGEKYDFKDEELDNVKTFCLPPQIKEEKSIYSLLTDTLETESPNLFLSYKNITDDFEQTINDASIDKIIEVVSSLLTVFNDIKLDLRRNANLIYIILLSINYRIIFLKDFHSTDSNKKFTDLLLRLKTSLVEELKADDYSENLISFLSSSTNHAFDKTYILLIKNVLVSQKKVSAYVSVVTFFVDLFLNISQYGEYYFEKEKLNHKINIKLAKGLFYDKIPNTSISIESNIDRRAIILNFKSKDPTVHKVAVLIVKDFEMRLSKFEESLKEIKLKLYYLLPKVKTEKYELENFHFDAYIPTLLPLLTGDNLYKQKEVFIRELIQNSIDATLLRKKVDPHTNFDTTIRIEFGIEKRHNNDIKYFKISDKGIGMSEFTIERYFTSIGRSFYVSEEFDELKKENKFTYNAISNFGIGFLSSFMICQEVIVKTKSHFKEIDERGLEIEIPNYEGCFFIKKIDIDSVGTEITLYEDERNLFNFDAFSEYIKSTMLSLPLGIEVVNTLDFKKNFKINPYLNQHSVLQRMQSRGSVFYIPFSENHKTAYHADWKELVEKDLNTFEKFGISFDFTQMMDDGNAVITLNQGLKISFNFLPLQIDVESPIPFITINYPSSFIQLDVARENIVSIKEGVSLKNVPVLLVDQVSEFLTTVSPQLQQASLYQINVISIFIKKNFKHGKVVNIVREQFCLKVERKKKTLVFSVVKNKNIPKAYNASDEAYFDLSNLKNFIQFIYFLKQNNELLSSPIKKNGSNDRFDNFLKMNLPRSRFPRSSHRQMLDLSFGYIDEWPDFNLADDLYEAEKSDSSNFKRLWVEFRRLENITDFNRYAEPLLQLNLDPSDVFFSTLNFYFFSDKARHHSEKTMSLEAIFTTVYLFQIFMFHQIKVKDYIQHATTIDFSDVYESQPANKKTKRKQK